FQAEDGIRDLTVTGVQTCALPIFQPVEPRGSQSNSQSNVLGIKNGATNLSTESAAARAASSSGARSRAPAGCLKTVSGATRRRRSEERRVGKECRRGGGG